MNRTEMIAATIANADGEVKPINSPPISPVKEKEMKNNEDGKKIPIEKEEEMEEKLIEDEVDARERNGTRLQEIVRETRDNKTRDVWREFFVDKDPPPLGYFKFRPVREQWSIDQCNLYGFLHNVYVLSHRFDSMRDLPNLCKATVAPVSKNIAGIEGDGNCLFRAISWWVTGSEEEHRALRLEIVNFMFNFPDIFGWVMTGEEGQKYTRETNRRMLDDGEWGTPCEIFGAATFLGVDIHTFHDGQWDVYRPLFEWTEAQGYKVTRMRTKEDKIGYSLYLAADNNLHYDVVFKQESIFDETMKRVEEVAKDVAKFDSDQREELLFAFHSIIHEKKNG